MSEIDSPAPEHVKAKRVGIDGLAKRLDRLHVDVRPRTDNVLMHVAFLGSSGVGVALGMVVDGLLMTGVIDTPKSFAAAVSDATRDAIAGSNWDDDLKNKVLAGFEDSEESIEEQLDRDREVVDRYVDEGTIDDLALDDVLSYMSAFQGRGTFDLRNVTIHVGGGDPLEVASLRVRVDSVSAWWPLKAQGINVVYVVRTPE